MRASHSGPDRRERAPERRLEAAVEPLDSSRLEVRDAERGRLDGEAGVLERVQDLLPGALGACRVGLDERERRAGRERLPQPHPRPHARCLGGRRHRPEQRLSLRLGSERRRAQRERRRPPQRRLQLEPGNGETCDHGNVCSIRTCVLLSSRILSDHRHRVRRKEREWSEEARLDEVGSGLAPVSPGWFVVNVGEAAWLRNDAFGGRCVFESSRRVARRATRRRAADVRGHGLHARRARARQALGMFHASPRRRTSSSSPGPVLLVEDRERPLRAWDFLHCPAGTRHTFVGTGRRAVRALHDGSPPRGQDDRLPRRRASARPRRRSRDGDERPDGGVRAVRALAARAA